MVDGIKKQPFQRVGMKELLVRISIILVKKKGAWVI